MSLWLDSTNDEKMAVLSKGFVPANTQKNNAWVMRVFSKWRVQRNGDISDKAHQCPENLLDDPDSKKLNFWLSRFVTEVRKQDGQSYPPRTIHQILSALQRKMIEKHPDARKFLDRKETIFSDFHRVCDSVYRELHSQGVGTDVRCTPVFTALIS